MTRLAEMAGRYARNEMSEEDVADYVMELEWRVRALEADPRMALTVEDLEDLVVHVLSQSDPDYWEKEYEIATRVGEALDAKEDDSE